jgi:hypothetical protein
MQTRDECYECIVVKINSSGWGFTYGTTIVEIQNYESYSVLVMFPFFVDIDSRWSLGLLVQP